MSASRWHRRNGDRPRSSNGRAPTFEQSRGCGFKSRRGRVPKVVDIEGESVVEMLERVKQECKRLKATRAIVILESDDEGFSFRQARSSLQYSMLLIDIVRVVFCHAAERDE